MKFKIIPAIIFVVILIPLSISLHRDYVVYTSGKLVSAVINSLPPPRSPVSSRYGGGNLMMKIEYDGNNYGVDIPDSLTKYHLGDTVALLYLQTGKEHDFLIPNHNPISSSIIPIIMLLGFFIASVYYAFGNE